MRLSYLTVNLIPGSLCKCDLNAKYNDAGNCGECILFSFFLSLVSTVFWLVCLLLHFPTLSHAPWPALFLELY